MRIRDETARRYWAGAGAEVDHDTMMVRYDRGLIEEKISLAQAEFTLRARNPAKSVTVGGNRILFSSVGDLPIAPILTVAGGAGPTVKCAIS